MRMNLNSGPRTLLCQADELAAHPEWQVFDCSFDLADATAGERAYAAAHIPGAAYLHIDRDLSAAKRPDPTTGRDPRGRHPMPDRARFAARIGSLGVTPGVQVVVVDRQGGMFAARAWWLLRWLGHRPVALLDGGLAAWQAAGGAVEAGPPPAGDPRAAPYPIHVPSLVAMVDTATLLADLGARRIVDARAAERYRGEVEPLDPVAGHIPGAFNRPFLGNLGADGRFKPVAQLRAEWAALLGEDAAAAADVVHHCGSGVTACHNLLAQELAGLGSAVLYPGSWSEWCADPARPVARG
jgi:thiosulfate/3-mercaptopyruvate sulfurtransferase